MHAPTDVGFFEGIARDAAVVGALLVWLPYTLSRAITNRIIRRRVEGRAAA